MPELSQPDARPYFLWWTDMTVAGLHAALKSDDPKVRAYWAGAPLREANTRDVWLFVTPAQIRELWPLLLRHLGRARSMWAFLLGLPEPRWPPDVAMRDELDRLCDRIARDAAATAGASE